MGEHILHHCIYQLLMLYTADLNHRQHLANHCLHIGGARRTKYEASYAAA